MPTVMTPPPALPDIDDPVNFPAAAQAALEWLFGPFWAEIVSVVALGGVTQTVQSSVSDATAGRLLMVGAGGLLGNGLLVGNAGVTTGAMPTTFYRYDTGAGSSGGPTGATVGTLLHQRTGTTSGESQEMIVVAGTGLATPGSVWTRVRTSGAWTAWSRRDGLINRTVIAAGAASCDVTFDASLYDAIEVKIQGLYPATAGASLWLRLGDAAGTTFVTAGYSMQSYHKDSAAAVESYGSAGAIALSPSTQANTVPGTSGQITILGPGAGLSTSTVHGMTFDWPNGSTPGGTTFNAYTAGGPHGSLRLMASTGNLGGGVVHVRGVPKS